MKLGLFLTPGAARTAYQVGAVQALINDGGLRFDVIGASSVGSLNGAFAATGQVDRLAELWASWRNDDILGIDYRAIVRRLFFWSTNLMHNRPQKTEVIDRYLGDAKLLDGTTFTMNLADLTNGCEHYLSWPGSDWALAEGVNASVAVPAAIAPYERSGRQFADGLTINGFPLEALVLNTGVQRVFVVGVTPREPPANVPTGLFGSALTAFEWNQYSETSLGLARVQLTQDRIRRFASALLTIRDLVAESVADEANSETLLRAIDDKVAAVTSFSLTPVEVITIMPRRPTKMFFTNYDPRRSQRLLADGRQDAIDVLAALNEAGFEQAGSSGCG